MGSETQSNVKDENETSIPQARRKVVALLILS